MWILIAILFVFGAWAFITRVKLVPYQKILNLQKVGLLYSQDYPKLVETVLPARKSVFSRSEPIIWRYNQNKTELFLTVNYKGDMRIWFQPKTILEGIHVVLDGSRNNKRSGTNLTKRKLPKQQIELEGDFSDYFKLYCGENQQIIALQIIAPNIMTNIIEKLLIMDIEIVDNQVGIISRSAAKNEERLIETVNVAINIDKLVKAATKVTKL